MESLHSDGSATYLLIIWVEKIIPLAMKSKQKPYPSIVFLSILKQSNYANILHFHLTEKDTPYDPSKRFSKLPVAVRVQEWVQGRIEIRRPVKQRKHPRWD